MTDKKRTSYELFWDAKPRFSRHTLGLFVYQVMGGVYEIDQEALKKQEKTK